MTSYVLGIVVLQSLVTPIVLLSWATHIVLDYSFMLCYHAVFVLCTCVRLRCYVSYV